MPNMVSTWSKYGPDMVKKDYSPKTFGLYCGTQSWRFQSSKWSGRKARANMFQIWSKYGSDMVPNSRHSVNINLRHVGTVFRISEL